VPVADATVIAELCDGVLLVVRSGSTPSSAAYKVYHELRTRNVVGIVLNGVREKTLTYNSYYERGHGQTTSVDATP
jgi:Mrp family chromosome partitioning ATPase